MNAEAPAAVAGGNVETSQRIVDVLLKAFAQIVPQRIPAASSGTMNNLTIGGIDPRTNTPFAYYETIAGGTGGRPTGDGVSGVHTHMTNSSIRRWRRLSMRIRFGCVAIATVPGLAVRDVIAAATG